MPAAVRRGVVMAFASEPATCSVAGFDAVPSCDGHDHAAVGAPHPALGQECVAALGLMRAAPRVGFPNLAWGRFALGFAPVPSVAARGWDILRPPRALLLDFGGVLVDAPPRNRRPLWIWCSESPNSSMERFHASRSLGTSARARGRTPSGVMKWTGALNPSSCRTLRCGQTSSPTPCPQARHAVEREATRLAYARTWR